MKFGIVTFPGSNCDYDTFHAIVDVLNEDAVYLWHKDHELQGSDVVILPGGFSYGDYLRPGAIARFSPIMQEVAAHAKRGGPVLAICNGFQIACEAGLLPGALLRNEGLKFVSEPVRLRVENPDTMFTNRYSAGQILTRRRSIGSRVRDRLSSATCMAPATRTPPGVPTERCAASPAS